MSGTDLFSEILRELFAARYPVDGGASEADVALDPERWDELTELGFTLVSVPEAAGGGGGSVADGCALVRIAGSHAVPLPLGETTLLGGFVAVAGGLQAPAGPLTAAPAVAGDLLTLEPTADGHRLSGRAHGVPWGAAAGTVLVLAREPGGALRVAAVPADRIAALPGANLAGEPRDDLVFDGCLLASALIGTPAPWFDEEELLLRGALLRAVSTAGALDRIQELTVGYARTRQQFGRSIARFQFVQNHLAELAREVALARTACELAVAAVPEEGPMPRFAIAVARVVGSRAATQVARHAHQIHGAIGVTTEYPLHLYTRRVLAWRDEYGSERSWARVVSEEAAQSGDRIWELLTATAPAV
ncbi:MAG TPA: acyl-CoA dehydrogenase family protein [Baekduia sp.]|jgi:acyl-CoA dehydrogenase